MFVILYIVTTAITNFSLKIPQTGNFDKLIRKAQKLQAIAADLQPFLELVRQLDGKDFTVPADRLIRSSEAAKILYIDHNAIGKLVKVGLLTPLYVNSDCRKFWLNEVMKLP